MLQIIAFLTSNQGKRGNDTGFVQRFPGRGPDGTRAGAADAVEAKPVAWDSRSTTKIWSPETCSEPSQLAQLTHGEILVDQKFAG